MRTPVVWIVKEQSARNSIGSNAMDYSSAEKYGNLRFITKSDMPLHSNSSIQLQWDTDAAQFTAEYDESQDFVIATGQPTAIFHIGWLLGAKAKTPRYLVWKREENSYRVLDPISF